VLPCVAICCSLLQSVAVCCSLLQWVTLDAMAMKLTFENSYQFAFFRDNFAEGFGNSESQRETHTRPTLSVCCSVLQCVAVCCSALQCAAVCCSEPFRVLPCVAVCCSVLQCDAVCYLNRADEQTLSISPSLFHREKSLPGADLIFGC